MNRKIEELQVNRQIFLQSVKAELKSTGKLILGLPLCTFEIRLTTYEL